MQPACNTTNNRTHWYLESIADTNREWMVAIESFPFVIGRDTDCSLKLTDTWISRRHTEIQMSGDLLWIRDLNSKNGTFVNQAKITQAELLEPGDTIAIGKFKFRLKSMEAEFDPTVEETTFLADKFEYPASMEVRLRDLILTRNVTPHYQPILSIPNMDVVGYEILGRINDPNLPASAEELFEMADWFECAFELSAMFREVGVEMSKTLPGSPVLFVNVTPMEIKQMDDLLESIENAHRLSQGTRLVIEINEKAVNEPEELNRLRDTVEALGMGLAFDDFGVGQTRLVELAKVPPDVLKFDISLIRNIHLAPARLHQMVATFVKAAQDLGVDTLAEGIECAEEAEACQQIGFNLVQGYYYGRPMPVDGILDQAGMNKSG